MRPSIMRELIDAYRWLWTAQQRWHPKNRWFAIPQFLGRVLFDVARYLTPSWGAATTWRASGRARWAVLACTLLVAIVAIEAQRRPEPGPTPLRTTWADSTGGFEIVFPASWEATEEASGTGMAGSAHRRQAGGTFLRRHLSARAYDLGMIAPLSTSEFAGLVTRTRMPDEVLMRPSRTAQDVYLSAYRSPEGDDDTSAVGVFFRGRGGHGFMLELTGHPDDEELLLEEAFAIADSIRRDDLVVDDLATVLSRFFAVSPAALQAASGEFSRVVDASLRFDVTSGTARPDQCRARAVLLWSQELAAATPISVPTEYRVTCATSSVVIRLDRGEITLRQFNEGGSIVYSQTWEPRFFSSWENAPRLRESPPASPG